MQYLDAISKTTEWSLFVSKANHSISGNPSLCPNQQPEEAEVERFYEDLRDLLELTPQKDVLFIIEDWNLKVGSQETPGITGKFGFEVQSEAGQHIGHNTFSNITRDDSTHGHPQMVNTEIRLIIFFGAKDGEALYSQQKYELELTITQIIGS